MDNQQMCDSLDEVRANIDRIDSALVALIAERAHFVRLAARFKKNSAEVRAPNRVEQVIAKALLQAASVGAPPAVVEAVYRAMIDTFIQCELGEHQQLHTPSQEPTCCGSSPSDR